MSLSVSTIAQVWPQIVAEPHPQTGLRIENILCPMNFSDFSLTAFKYAECLARRMRSRLFVQHTVQIPSTVSSESQEIFLESQPLDALKQRAGVRLRRTAAVARLLLPEVRLLVNEGDTYDRVLQSIEQNNIDLVVMGTSDHKNSQDSNWNLLTERIVCDSRCPVLVVCRPQKDFVNPDESHPAHLRTIVLASDLSPYSDYAVVEALNWAASWSAHLIAFHAVQKGSSESAMQSSCGLGLEKQLAQALDRTQKRFPALANKKIAISREVRTGDAHKLVLELAEEKNADLIVMGSRGSGLTAKSWGSTITAVVRDGRFPVLAVPRSMFHPKQPGANETYFSR
jgi:nucleotide-binding universal stress UspA family protein